ncbi:hypothetical protein ADK60_20310 [Streptomyces sp. XY431]|uniref:hypothetical protein n=1 Tax=Streptomyces sp. XY431 TaxID=1415562 RepID=UPI0006ADDFB2|nr:hypothetical protein [Streptomyces sp. XY431]KOV26981.1 hypothetical protein ADK60_20310 [Streptomyces sp. XY431]
MIGTTDRMRVDYAQYYLYGTNYVEGEDHNALERVRTGNSVAAAAPDHLTVSCGTHAGAIRLSVEGRMDPPGPPQADWETVVDLSLFSAAGELGVQPWGGQAADGAVRGNLAVAGAGWYRVRVETRGRDKGRALNVANPWVEEHRLTLWPAPPAPDHVHRVTDEVGKATYDPTRPADPPIPPIPPAPSADDSLLRAWARSAGIAVDDNKPIPRSVRALAVAAGVLPTHHEA